MRMIPQTDSKTEENPSGSGESDNSSDEDAIPLNGRNSGSGKEETSDTEQGRIPYHQSESLSEPVGGSVEKTKITSGSITTVRRLILNAFWIKWRKRRPASSWRMKGFRS